MTCWQINYRRSLISQMYRKERMRTAIYVKRTLACSKIQGITATTAVLVYVKNAQKTR